MEISNYGIPVYSDVERIHDGIGSKLGLLLQLLGNFVGTYVVAFVFEWRLALVMLVFAPISILIGYQMTTVWEISVISHFAVSFVLEGYQHHDQSGAEGLCLCRGRG